MTPERLAQLSQKDISPYRNSGDAFHVGSFPVKLHWICNDRTLSYLEVETSPGNTTTIKFTDREKALEVFVALYQRLGDLLGELDLDGNVAAPVRPTPTILEKMKE